MTKRPHHPAEEDGDDLSALPFFMTFSVMVLWLVASFSAARPLSARDVLCGIAVAAAAIWLYAAFGRLRREAGSAERRSPS